MKTIPKPGTEVIWMKKQYTVVSCNLGGKCKIQRKGTVIMGVDIANLKEVPFESAEERQDKRAASQEQDDAMRRVEEKRFRRIQLMNDGSTHEEARKIVNWEDKNQKEH